MARAPTRSNPLPSPRPGVGVDAYGGVLIDPSENVKALSEASSKRLDDLMAASDRRVDTEIHQLQVIAEKNELIAALRSAHNAEVSNARADHLAEIIKLQSTHTGELNDKESRRIDAIRQVDVTASARDAAAGLIAIQTLAAQTARDAETLRSLVASTATTTANQLAATVGGITDRIAKLEQASWSTAGRQMYADPMITEIAQKLDRLSRRESESTGASEGSNALWGYLIGGIGLVMAIVTVAVLLARTVPH